MADSILLNKALLNGSYDSSAVELDSNILSTTIVTGLTVTKSASADIWLNGYLTYTVTIANDADEDFVDPIMTDTLDITQIALVDNSVKINGVTAAYTYDSETGLLTVEIPTVTAGTSATVTFQVQMI